MAKAEMKGEMNGVIKRARVSRSLPGKYTEDILKKNTGGWDATEGPARVARISRGEKQEKIVREGYA